jgi:hypothetical protein
MDICKHNNAFFFHENAPLYCPQCESYIDGGMIITKGKKYILLERKKKIDKILEK